MSIYYIDRPDFAPFVSNYPQRPVYSGNVLALEGKVVNYAVDPGSSLDLLSIYGVGRFSGGIVVVGGSFGWADMALIKLEILIDGSSRAKWSLQEIETFNGLNLFNKASGSAASGWYYPDVLHPIISSIAGKWNAANNAFEEYYFYLNFIAEFTESIVFRGINNTSNPITFTIRALVGYYP